MQDDLRDRVVRAIAQADRESDDAPMFAESQQATPQPPRLLEIADIELVASRHRQLAQMQGYRLGLEHGRAQGAVEQARVLSRRLEAAATQLIGLLNDVPNGKPKKSELLAVMATVRRLLGELSSLVNPA